MVIAAILLSTSAYTNVYKDNGEAAVPRESLSTLPASFQGWESSDQTFPPEILSNLKVDEYLMRRFSKGGTSIWLFIGYYRHQKEGAVPHSPRHCYPGSGFVSIRNGITVIPVNDPGKREIRPNKYVFAKGAEREVVIYWYQSRGRVIADEYMEKLYLIRDTIFRKRSDGALVRFSISTSEGGVEYASRQLMSFVSAYYPNIPRVVPD